MSKRINIVLSDETLAVLDRVAPRGNRSRLIAHAVRQYMNSRSRQNLRQRLKEGYLANAKLNLDLAQEWFPLEGLLKSNSQLSDPLLLGRVRATGFWCYS